MSKLVMAVLASTAWATSALAQNAPPEQPDPLTSPRFAELDRADGASRGGLDLTYLVVKGGGTTALRFDAYGEYIDKHYGLGGYVQLPVFYGNGSGMTSGGIGDVEVGAIYARAVSASFGIALRAGATLPSGATGDNGAFDQIVSFARSSDFYLAIPKGASLRLAASPLVRVGVMFARVDLGVDVNFSQDGMASFPTIYRLNVGVGALIVPQVAVTLENVNTFIGSSSTSTGSNIDVGALSVRYAGGTAHPFVAVSIPLDSASRTVFDAFLSAGIDVALH